jgi:hypothetical protein
MPSSSLLHAIQSGKGTNGETDGQEARQGSFELFNAKKPAKRSTKSPGKKALPQKRAVTKMTQRFHEQTALAAYWAGIGPRGAPARG